MINPPRLSIRGTDLSIGEPCSLSSVTAEAPCNGASADLERIMSYFSSLSHEPRRPHITCGLALAFYTSPSLP